VGWRSTGFSLWGYRLHVQELDPQAEACATGTLSRTDFYITVEGAAYTLNS